MRYNNIELSVLVNGKPVTEYQHNTQTFVEGRSGSKFEIQVKNNNLFRVEAVISVDGLSIIDGKEAGPDSTGYLIDAGKTVSIPGWKLNSEQVAAFVFAGKKDSYAGLSTGSDRNTGVIGVMTFAEKVKPIPQYVINRYDVYDRYDRFYPSYPKYPFNDGIWCSSSAGADSALRSMQGVGMNSMSGMVQSSYSAKGMSDESMTCCVSDDGESIAQQNLGTEFGKAEKFKTTQVSFERGLEHATIILYYDDARGLKSRGIDLSRRAKNKVNQVPAAFPGMNCMPPKGWKG